MIRSFNGKIPRIAESAYIIEAAYVVGVPGKIRGETSSEQLWWVQKGPEIYAERIKQYKQPGL